MANLYGRRFSLIVGSGATGLELTPDPNNLPKVTFSVRQGDREVPNHAAIRVWNLNDDTVNRVQHEFTRVILQAGYVNGNYGVVFDGTIIQTRKGNENAVDSYLDIIAADGDLNYSKGVISSAVAKGSTFKQRLDALQKAMAPYGITGGSICELPAGQLPRGRVYYGMIRDHMRGLAFSSDTLWSIQNGQLQLIPLDGYLPGEAIVLTSRTGLIGFPEQTEAGIRIKCLLNPQIRPGARVQIDNKSLQQATLGLGYTTYAEANAFLPSISDDGVYRVIVNDLDGDTRGDAWYCNLTCIAMNQPLTPSLQARGYT